MKTIKTIAIIAATAFVLALSSCKKEEAPSSPQTPTGEEIIFTAGSDNADTKTVYSGSESDDRERIDWQSGDQMRIYCDQLTSSPKYGDYAVSEVLGPDESNPYISKARVKALGEKPLEWGAASPHYFYSAYPSPNYGESSAVKSIGKSSTSGHVEASAIIPAEQPYVGEVAVDGFSYVAEPNLRNMVMTAKAGPYTVEPDIPGRKEVFMSFIPLTTAVRFTITNQTKEPLDVVSVSLISESHALNGNFTVDIDNASKPADVIVGGKTIASYSRAYPACTRSEAVTDAEKTVTIPFEGVVLPYDDDKSKCGSLTFTFFLQPTEHLDDLTFKLVKKVGENTSWLSTKLAYADAARTGLTFPKHKKSEVTGLLIPEGAIWTVKYEPEVVSWGEKDHGEINPNPEFAPEVLVTSWTVGAYKDIEMLKYNYTMGIEGETNFGHEGTTLLPEGKSTLNLSSFRESDFQYSDVLWYMEHFNETTGTWELVKNNVPVNNFVTISVPAGSIVSSDNEIICNGDVTMHMSVAEASGSEVKPSQSHTARLSNAEPKGTATAPYDLSMHTIYGDARTKAKTANSYIISAKGTYAFPLVYGNAIDDNVAPAGFINVNAYNPGGETDPTVNVLTRFRNYKGYGIRQPYIEEDLSLIPVTGTTPLRHVTSANVVWQSGSCVKNCIVKSATEAWGMGLTSMKGAGMGTNACGYVIFEVDNTIAQGNAVIAIKDEDGNIIWSWHIWITDDEMDLVTFRNYGGQTLKMLPVDLGWVDGDDTAFTYYEGKSVRLRLVQEGSNIVKEFTVVRRPETTASHESGTSTYYQWGRKDPFMSNWTTKACDESTDIAYSIQHPGEFITGGNSYYSETINTDLARYLNLWSALVKEVGTTVNSSTTIKTIYDPCPPGFQIPHGTAYTGFTSTGANSDIPADFNVSGSFNNGWYFTTGAGEEKNFFPAGGYVVYSSGSVDKSGTNGYYWTSVPIGFGGKGGSLIFSSNSVNVTDVANQSDGFTVRPVMEEHL